MSETDENDFEEDGRTARDSPDTNSPFDDYKEPKANFTMELNRMGIIKDGESSRDSELRTETNLDSDDVEHVLEEVKSAAQRESTDLTPTRRDASRNVLNIEPEEEFKVKVQPDVRVVSGGEDSVSPAFSRGCH